MKIQTTCIGAYPKPAYVPILDWFATDIGFDTSQATRHYNELMDNNEKSVEDLLIKATGEVIDDQISAGIDVPTDGEIRRENYIHYHCRHLTGIDFNRLTARTLRDGAYETQLPTITGKIHAGETPFLTQDYKIAQSFTDRPAKMTIPGPMTIADTTVDRFYGDRQRLIADLADAVNVEVRALAGAGCRYIQIDEPLFAREVDVALEYGIEALSRCFKGLPEEVSRIVHICCGYPRFLDDTDYHKADHQAYFKLAEALDAAPVDQISLEDAHRPNDLTLLEKFSHSTVILGVVAIARSGIEPVEDIRQRLKDALHHIDPHRLVAAPDCGLGYLDRSLAIQKLTNLCDAAHSV